MRIHISRSQQYRFLIWAGGVITLILITFIPAHSAYACTPPVNYDPNATPFPLDEMIQSQIEGAEVIFIAEIPEWDRASFNLPEQIPVHTVIRGPELPQSIRITGYSPGFDCPDHFPSGGIYLFFAVTTDQEDIVRVLRQANASGIPAYAHFAPGSEGYELTFDLLGDSLPELEPLQPSLDQSDDPESSGSEETLSTDGALRTRMLIVGVVVLLGVVALGMRLMMIKR